MCRDLPGHLPLRDSKDTKGISRVIEVERKVRTERDFVEQRERLHVLVSHTCRFQYSTRNYPVSSESLLLALCAGSSQVKSAASMLARLAIWLVVPVSPNVTRTVHRSPPSLRLSIFPLLVSRPLPTGLSPPPSPPKLVEKESGWSDVDKSGCLLKGPVAESSTDHSQIASLCWAHVGPNLGKTLCYASVALAAPLLFSLPIHLQRFGHHRRAPTPGISLVP